MIYKGSLGHLILNAVCIVHRPRILHGRTSGMVSPSCVDVGFGLMTGISNERSRKGSSLTLFIPHSKQWTSLCNTPPNIPVTTECFTPARDERGEEKELGGSSVSSS